MYVCTLILIVMLLLVSPSCPPSLSPPRESCLVVVVRAVGAVMDLGGRLVAASVGRGAVPLFPQRIGSSVEAVVRENFHLKLMFRSVAF